MRLVFLLLVAMLVSVLVACAPTEEDDQDVQVDPNAPVLATIGNKSVTVNNQLNFTVSATDPNGDAVTLSVEMVSGNNIFDGNNAAVFTPDSGSFLWTPTSTGTHDLRFIATDESTEHLQDSEVVRITVQAAGGGGETPTGQSLYIQHCQSCHGTNGAGGSASAIRCAEFADINSAVNTGPGSMPTFIFLTSDQRQAISDYLVEVGGSLCDTLTPN